MAVFVQSDSVEDSFGLASRCAALRASAIAASASSDSGIIQNREKLLRTGPTFYIDLLVSDPAR